MSTHFEGPLSVHNVKPWRELCQDLPTGVSPATSSRDFKTPGCAAKPKAKEFSHFISPESASRTGSTLKVAAKYLKTPGIISLGGGLPSPDFFPFERIRIDVSQPMQHHGHSDSAITLDAKRGDVREGKSFYDLEVALNYGQAVGSAQLLRFVTEHTEIVHNPPYSDWQCCLTSGTTYSWDSTLRMLAQRGDYILMEEYTFSSAQETALPLGLNIVPVPMDNQGLIPDSLDEILSCWDLQARGAAKPHVLYMIPTGHNPTGYTQPASRRQAIYKVAQRHDLCVVEDEPYLFLQSPTMTSEGQAEAIDDQRVSHEQFIRNLIPSYLSMDVDGRVLRLDSFSKVLAPGLRVGWIVGPEQLVERFTRGCETSNQNPSGVSQLMIYKLLDEHWGHSGYLRRLMELQKSYAVRRRDMIRACEIYLPREAVSWEAPIAGMFHWIGVDWRKHPRARSGLSPEDIEESVFQAAVQAGVLLCRGSWFRAGGKAIEGSLYFRTTYAAAESHDIFEAVNRLGKALRLEFKITE